MSLQSSRDTVRFEEGQWVPPVETAERLPVGALRDGTLCYVQDENAVYRLHNGIWLKTSELGAAPPSA